MFNIKQEVKELLDEYRVEIIDLKKVLKSTNQLLTALNVSLTRLNDNLENLANKE